MFAILIALVCLAIVLGVVFALRRERMESEDEMARRDEQIARLMANLSEQAPAPAQVYQQPPAQPHQQQPAQVYQQAPDQAYQQPPAQAYRQQPAPGYQQPPAQAHRQAPAQVYQQPPAPGYQQAPVQAYQDEPLPVREARSEPEFIITGLDNPRHAAPVEDAPSQGSTRIVVNATVGEALIKGASFAHGVRRAVSADARYRIRFEVGREVRRARKQRRKETKEAMRRMRSDIDAVPPTMPPNGRGTQV